LKSDIFVTHIDVSGCHKLNMSHGKVTLGFSTVTERGTRRF